MSRQEAARPVVVSPFANERVREWPIAHYRRFIERVLCEHRIPVAIVGTRAQRARADELVRGFPYPAVVNACGRLSWHELVRLVDAAPYVVANNSGIAHLAAARGRWTLCIFSGSHSWVEWMPRGPRVVVVTRVTACAPCALGGDRCPNGLACMTDLAPDAAFDLFAKAGAVRHRDWMARKWAMPPDDGMDTDPVNPLVPPPEDGNGAAGETGRAVTRPDLADAEWEWLIRERDLAVAARQRAVRERDDLVLARFRLLRERDTALAAAADRDRLAEERDRLAAETVRLAAAVREGTQDRAQFFGQRAALARELVRATRVNALLTGERERLVRTCQRAVAERDAIAAALLSAVGDAEALAARRERTLARRLERRLHGLSGWFRLARGRKQRRS
jgi:hypothetical protein